MDYLRSCYYSYMRLYPDRPDVLTYGRWRRCPPGAIDTPTSVFFARRNDLDDTADRPLGEVYQRSYRYSRGESDPRLNGQHYCGSPSVWLSGILYDSRPGLVLDASGVPLCCQAGPPPPARLRLHGRGARVRIGHGPFALGGHGRRVVTQSSLACSCESSLAGYIHS
jgi:hypothetical protein